MYVQLTDSVEELITLTEIKEFTRINTTMTVDDGLLMALLSSVITYCEKYTGLSISLKEYEKVFGCKDKLTDECFELRKGPVDEISSIVINDVDGSTIVDLDDMKFKNYKQSTKVYIPNGNLSLGSDKLEPLVCTFTAGYTADTLPKTLKTAMLQLLAYWYENRETAQIKDETIVAEMPLGTTALLNIHRLVRC